MSTSQRQEMGRKGLTLVQSNFAWTKIACQMRSVYAWVLGCGAKTTPAWSIRKWNWTFPATAGLESILTESNFSVFSGVWGPFSFNSFPARASDGGDSCCAVLAQR